MLDLLCEDEVEKEASKHPRFSQECVGLQEQCLHIDTDRVEEGEKVLCTEDGIC